MPGCRSPPKVLTVAKPPDATIGPEPPCGGSGVFPPGGDSVRHPLLQGWMEKKRSKGLFSRWQRRWFRADPHSLSYYTDGGVDAPRRSICLDAVEISHHDSCPRTLLFRESGGRSYQLRAASEEEATAWARALRLAKAWAEPCVACGDSAPRGARCRGGAHFLCAECVGHHAAQRAGKWRDYIAEGGALRCGMPGCADASVPDADVARCVSPTEFSAYLAAREHVARHVEETRREAARATDEEVRRMGAKRCPKCTRLTEPPDMCRHMTCACGHEYFWCCLRNFRDRTAQRLHYKECCQRDKVGRPAEDNPIAALCEIMGPGFDHTRAEQLLTDCAGDLKQALGKAVAGLGG